MRDDGSVWNGDGLVWNGDFSVWNDDFLVWNGDSLIIFLLVKVKFSSSDDSIVTTFANSASNSRSFLFLQTYFCPILPRR